MDLKGFSTRLPGYEEEARFYDYHWDGMLDDRLYLRLAGRAKRVLDCMCGTGRLTFPFARGGAFVHGIDNSKPMIAIAREKLRKEPPSIRRRITFAVCDVRSFPVREAYDFAVIGCNSFPLILSARGRESALRCIHRALVPGGKLVVQVDAPSSYDLRHAVGPSVSRVRFVPRDNICYIRSNVEVPLGPHVVQTISHHVILGRTFEIREEARTATRTAIITGAEVRHLLTRVGFTVDTVLGDFDGKLLEPSDSQMITVATKADV